MNIDSMIQGNPQALVTSYNGVLVADSLEVADRFGKAHKNVVRDIENLMDGIEANRLNFEPIAEKEYFIPDFYTDKRNISKIIGQGGANRNVLSQRGISFRRKEEKGTDFRAERIG